LVGGALLDANVGVGQVRPLRFSGGLNHIVLRGSVGSGYLFGAIPHLKLLEGAHGVRVGLHLLASLPADPARLVPDFVLCHRPLPPAAVGVVLSLKPTSPFQLGKRELALRHFSSGSGSLHPSDPANEKGRVKR
jgi:hypothetical protein